MPRFAYRAKQGPTEIKEGVIEAESQHDAVRRLSNQGLIPVTVTQTAGGPAKAVKGRPAGRVSPHEITSFTRQLAGLMKSHIPVLRALDLIRTQAERPGLKSVVGRMADAVRDGQPLSDGFGQFPALFSPLYRALVRAGEVSGRMDDMLARLVEHREQEASLREKVSQAAIYPAFVLVAGAATVAVLMIVVIPKLSVLLQDLHQALPLPTRVVMAAGDFASRTWWGWALGLALGWIVMSSRIGGRILLDRLQLTLPIWRGLTRNVEAAHFTRTLGVLLDSGIPILQAVATAVPTVENRLIRASLAPIEKALASGVPLAKTMERVPVFSPMVVGLVTIGEESGDLPRHLLDVAKTLEEDVERSLKVVTTLLEPCLMLVMGLIVAFIVAAMLLPVFEIGTGIESPSA